MQLRLFDSIVFNNEKSSQAIQHHTTRGRHPIIQLSAWSPKAAYTEKVEKPGFFLGMLDLYILSIAHGKNLLLLLQDGEEFRYRFISEILQGLGHAELHDATKPDVEGEDTWIICGASATWTPVPVLQLNHWFPAWTKKRLGDEWEGAMEKSKDAAEQEKSALAASLVHANQRNTEDDVEAKANLESLLDEWDKVVRKQGFLQRLYDFGVCPFDVPGDGDCGIHSVLSHLNGAPHSTNGVYESHEELSRAVQEKRSESGHFVVFFFENSFL